MLHSHLIPLTNPKWTLQRQCHQLHHSFTIERHSEKLWYQLIKVLGELQHKLVVVVRVQDHLNSTPKIVVKVQDHLNTTPKLLLPLRDSSSVACNWILAPTVLPSHPCDWFYKLNIARCHHLQYSFASEKHGESSDTNWYEP